MPRSARWAAVLTAAAATSLAALALANPGAGKAPGLPPGFRAWMHVKSMAVTDREHGMYGFHNVYANKEALKGLRARGQARTFERGATFVVSIFEVETKEGTLSAGAKRRDVVQVKDPAATATGGWRFAAFDPAGTPIAIDAAACAGCHAAARATDSVYATLTE
ncbi:MAG TPA: cytochrome P460 family protein [Polyangia bacterium]|jgi:hypothetical protein